MSLASVECCYALVGVIYCISLLSNTLVSRLYLHASIGDTYMGQDCKLCHIRCWIHRRSCHRKQEVPFLWCGCACLLRKMQSTKTRVPIAATRHQQVGCRWRRQLVRCGTFCALQPLLGFLKWFIVIVSKYWPMQYSSVLITQLIISTIILSLVT